LIVLSHFDKPFLHAQAFTNRETYEGSDPVLTPISEIITGGGEYAVNNGATAGFRPQL
jgi:hypothetical protein